MRGNSRLRGQAAATTILCLMVGAAITLHDRAPHDQGDRSAAVPDDPHAGHLMPEFVPAALAAPSPLPRAGWVVTADGASDTADRVLDGDPSTFWRTDATALPHQLTIDMRRRVSISGLTYLPPSDSPNGRIGQYSVQLSDNGTTWSAPAATGTFADDGVLKTITINTTVTRYVRLNAITEAGTRGTWAAAAELNVLGGTDPALPRTGWTARADSAESKQQNGAAANAVDGNTTSMWHTAWSVNPIPKLPHWLEIDMKTTSLVSGLSHLTRQDPSRNGAIGQYRVETSMGGGVWAPVAATGRFADTKLAQSVTFAPRLARYVRLTALSEAGDRGQWSAVAEVNVLGRANPTLGRTGWTVSASSQEVTSQNTPASAVLDGNAATFWHSKYNPTAVPLPHTITLDTKKSQTVGGLSYLPRPAASPNGRIGRYTIATSTDNTTWTNRVTNASFADNPALQTVTFPSVTARYVRLIASTEAGNRGQWSAAAELNVLGEAGSVSPRRGSWSAPVGFPLVPASAALLPNGKILTWSAFQPDAFSGGTGKTVTAIFDPKTRVVSARTVIETGHDMFCPGISMLADGRIIVTGGNDNQKTSIYNPRTDTWASGPPMKLPRGYQSSVTLGDGRVFTIGGSWSGFRGGQDGNPHKYGEIYSTANGWTALPGADAAPMLTADNNPAGDYRKDNHAWLFAWSGNRVLQAGPSKRMNWYGVSGTGSVTAAGTRGDDGDAMNGNAIMYDTGRILTVGGAAHYQQIDARANAYVLSVNGTTVTTRKVASMANTRAFHNSVALPDGKVMVVGGQNFPVPFSDNTAVLGAEMWDPVSESFTTMATATVPRTYHSVALLLPDARVFAGGGGLCGTGCTTNHADAQIFTPPYLLNDDGSAAARPEITSAPDEADNGDTITVRTDKPVSAFAIIRTGTATHSVNTDQRRLSLQPTPVDGGYELTVPADPGIAVPGDWMLFAMDAKGVPSVASMIKIG